MRFSSIVRAGYVALTAAAAVSACAPATRTSGKVTGEIISQKNGQALYPGFVDVLTTATVSAKGDSTGRFVIDSLPPGEHAIAGLGWAHYFDVKFVRIEPGDSVHVRFSLAPGPEAILLFPLPTPDDELLDEATRLIPTVLSSVSIRDLIAESLDSAGMPAVVWAPWARKAGQVVTADGVRLPFTAVGDTPRVDSNRSRSTNQ